MTPTPDTSPEAVDAVCLRVAELNDGNAWPSTIALICDLRDMLRAVADERDNWQMLESIPHRRLEAAEAEAAALREALRNVEALEIDWRLSTAENMRAASDIARAALKENHDGR